MDTSFRPALAPARPRPMLRIFLSSTSLDLKAHRTAMRRLIDTFDEHPVVMDDFSAHDGDATTVSLQALASADIYVLLLAWRYGTIPKDETLSVTHLEYRAAKAAGKPRLIFLADPATEKDDGPAALFPAAVRDPEHAELLRDFRKEVGDDRVAAFFTTPESAALALAAALHRYIEHELPRGPRPPHKLPPRAPEFVGRARELAELCERLRAGNSVGLSALVAGLAGVGKSALAAEAVATLAAEPETFPGGVTWARCDGREGLGGLVWLYDQLLMDWGAPLSPEQLTQAQTVSLEEGIALREHVLQNALRTRLRAATPDNGAFPPALVLLDNVEVQFPLARALDTFASLGITALVTARHLPAVPRLRPLPLDVLDPSAAAQLFAERYREKGVAWDDGRDMGAAAAIVERLGRLPLAIELQAARAALRQESVAQVSAGLERDRSQGLLGDPLDATRNMRYSFDQSLKTLTPLQQTRFAALGLPGGPDWPRAVIERLLAGIQEQGEGAADMPNEAEEAKDDDDGEPSASELAAASADLDLFVALSLVNLAEGRARLHPLLREHAYERWRDAPARTQTAGLRALLAGIETLVTEREHDFAALASEEEMIVAALDMAQENKTAPRNVIGIVGVLHDYLILGGHWRLGMRLYPWQLAAWREVGNRRGEGAALNNLGYLADSLGRPNEARGYFEQALAIIREIGDREGEGITLNNLGLLAYSVGQPDEARGYFEQALPILREVGNRNMEGTTLNNLGALAYGQGRPDEAREYFEQALPIAREVGDRSMEGTILNNLGQLADGQGRPDEARGYFEQALPILREVGNRSGEGAILNNLGALAYGQGRPDEAREYYQQALPIAREVGDRSMEGTILNNLGELARSLGQPDEARGYFEQALPILREVGNRNMEGTTLNNLGQLARSLGQPDEARSYYEQALAIFRDIGAVDSARITAENLAYLERERAARDDTSDAEPSMPEEKAQEPKTKKSRRWRWPWSR